MNVPHQVALLAIKPLIEGACKSVGADAAIVATDVVVRFLSDRFTDHSQHLSTAVARATGNAWRALEVALGGDSWWERVTAKLTRAEDRALREQVRQFLAVTPLAGLPSHGDEFRTRCLAELRAARRRGLLDGGVQLDLLARRAAGFVHFDDPTAVLRAERQTLAELAGAIAEAGYRTLADFLKLEPREGSSILAVAVRYFFRREIEGDSALFQGLAFAQLERLDRGQEQAFAALQQALAGQGDRLAGLLDEVSDVVRETHGEVKEIRAALEQHGQQLQAVGQAVLRSLAQPRDGTPDNPVRAEQNLRLDMLNTLLTTPHRRLEQVWPIHEQLIVKDPRFYVQLAAWYCAKGAVRDHQEAFIVALVLSPSPDHRNVGLALLRALPPYQVVRVVDFIHGRAETRRRYIKEESDEWRAAVTRRAARPRTRAQIRAAKSAKPTAPSRYKRIPVRSMVGTYGLGRNLPASLRTEIRRYLREREANPDWFDSTVLVARAALKRLYALLHVKPGERAQQVLFADRPPPDSRLHGLKSLARLDTPEAQARAIAELRVPFRVAVSVLRQITPAVLEALIERMSAQELINSLDMLQRHGAMADANLRALIDLKLEEAHSARRVSTFKADTAMEAVDVDAALRRKLEELTDVQIKARGRIRRPTALLIDKSGSMEEAIDVGKRIAAMLSSACEQELYVYAFDTMAFPVQAKGSDWAAWKRAFADIVANGRTSCGISLEVMRRKGQRVEQIIVVTDEEEYDPPFFVDSLLRYRQALGVEPAVCFVRVKDSSRRLEDQCKQAGLSVSAFDFTGDYFALPNLVTLLEPPSELDLLMEIMDYPLPERRPAT